MDPSPPDRAPRAACTLPLLLVACLTAGCAPGAPRSAPDPPSAEWRKYSDAETGHEVWQITSGDSASQACYFETQCFTADERFVVFGSRRTGAWQIYRADLSGGEITRLTEAAALGPGSLAMHPNGEDAYFIDGWTLRRVSVASGRAETVFDFHGTLPEAPSPAPISFSADGRYTVVAGRMGGETLLVRLSLPDRKPEIVLRWPGTLSHPQLNPAEPDLITFVPGPDTQNDMTLPMEQRARTWIVDARTQRPRRFLTMPYGYRATHELWAPSGDRFYFYRKSQPGWVPVSIVSTNRDGEDWRVHYTDDSIRLGHGDISDDGRWFVSDGQTPGRNPLLLVSLRTGRAEVLSWPNASISGGHPKQAHVHPSFSPRGTYVLHTSDRTGIPQVYVVPVPRTVKDRLTVPVDTD